MRKKSKSLVIYYVFHYIERCIGFHSGCQTITDSVEC